MSHPRAVSPGEALHPVYLVWELTLRCDQACLHCGSRAGRPRPRELDTDEALAVARQVGGIGIREVTLIGGEFYLRPDWAEIARTIADQGVRCSIVTGGRGFGAREAEQARDARVDTVSVSVDGPRDTHDALRAVPGSWDAAMRAIDAARDAGIAAGVNTQLNRRNLTELDELADALLARGVATWQVQLTVPMGRAAGGDAFVLQPYDLLELFPRLAAVATRVRPRGLRLMASNNVGYYGPYEALLRPGAAWQGCSAGGWILGLQSDGTVKGCASLPTDAYGAMNVRDGSLAEIFARSEVLRSTRERVERWGHCATCYYGSVCRGGCTWAGHTLFGRPGNNPMCHHRALELAARGRRERLVPAAAAPEVPFGHGLWEIVEEEAG